MSSNRLNAKVHKWADSMSIKHKCVKNWNFLVRKTFCELNLSHLSYPENMGTNYVQPIPNPNFTQLSPTLPAAGFSTSTPNNLQPMMNPNIDANNKLDILTQKVIEICDKMSVLDEQPKKFNSFDKTVQTLVKTVKNVSKRVDEVEKSMNFVNEQFEINKNDVIEVRSAFNEIRSEKDATNNTIFRLQQDLDDLYDRHIDLQTRSIRENLTFTGIPLHDKDEQTEQTEKIIENFMVCQLKLNRPAEYERAHRFGKEYIERNKRWLKREFVRKAARKLRDTGFGISEQFPKEINDRRKTLWPFFHKARRKGKKAFFRRDRLFIDGVEFFPPEKTDQQNSGVSRQQPRRNFDDDGARPKSTQRNNNGRRFQKQY
ncbi:unnamed protein product [Mytilus coruscus]|uniref:Uncharacterized protein n=1 Tax=Mytilus coruscus TaxID=42192 RepID=A0A6J8DVP9_MYTCO|nr:unnamed protein product [Mytilus coruscus]